MQKLVCQIDEFSRRNDSETKVLKKYRHVNILVLQ